MIAGLIFERSKLNKQYYEVTGPAESLEILKDKLTLVNKSIEWAIYDANNSMKFWKSQGDNEFVNGKVNEIALNIENLTPQLTEEYYGERDGKLVVPAGYWNYAEKVVGDDHLNTLLKPKFVPGLRHYQTEAITALMLYKRATCVLGTGLGKTMVISSIVLTALEEGLRVLIVVPSEYLIKQVVETVSRYTDSITSASATRHISLGKSVLVTTPITAKKYADIYDVIIIDESHRSAASSWTSLLSDVEKAEYVYNLTATPFRADGLDLAIHAFGGPVVFSRDAKWGIQNGWLANFDVYTYRFSSYKDGRQVVCGDKTKKPMAYGKIVGNKDFLMNVLPMIVKAYNNGRKIMVIFKSLKPAEILKKLLDKEGIDTQVANGEYKLPLVKFANDESRLLLATDKLISEGVDIPGADVLFVLTQHSSPVTTYQSIGRVLRKAKDKKKPLIIDIEATGYRGFQSAGEKRLEIYKDLADTVSKN